MHTLAIIGYGAQARAWAANLRDSGSPPTIFLRRSSPQWDKIHEDAMRVKPLGAELGNYRHFALLIPDHIHSDFLKNWGHHLPDGSLIVLAHGQSFIKDQLGKSFPTLDFALLAPKAIAGEVRRRYLRKEKLGACLSTEGVKRGVQAGEEFLRALASRIGMTTLVPSTFREEAHADLFSEQGLLCSALPYMALHSYNKLREKGHSKEVAYMECWMEVKLIADAMVSLGPEEFFRLISPMALVGGELARGKLLDSGYFDKLEDIYRDIESGAFFERVDGMDFQEVRKKVLDFWKNQELTRTHEELKGRL